MMNSWREKYLTVKKKAASLQQEHGGSPDYLIMIKNNIPDSSSSKSAGKYMVMAEGPLRNQLLSHGVKFVENNCMMMANSWDMTEEIIATQDGSDTEVTDLSSENSSKSSNSIVTGNESDKSVDIMNMKKYAKKVGTPGMSKK